MKIRDVELFKGFTGVLAHFRCNRPALFGRAHAKTQRKPRTRLCHAWSGAPFFVDALQIPKGGLATSGIMAVDLTVLVARRPVMKIRDVELFKGLTGVLAHFRCNRPAAVRKGSRKEAKTQRKPRTTWGVVARCGVRL
jgi:hypothetical protein